ncbi:extensin-like [Vombatus ursinus]|uniref:extensin-like n=1 Tax=Vombatus ursinus TaxID=29139 RepID=UPI000FFD3814|nr:extensin-like [Vombatus ursinus]
MKENDASEGHSTVTPPRKTYGNPPVSRVPFRGMAGHLLAPGAPRPSPPRELSTPPVHSQTSRPPHLARPPPLAHSPEGAPRRQTPPPRPSKALLLSSPRYFSPSHSRDLPSFLTARSQGASPPTRPGRLSPSSHVPTPYTPPTPRPQPTGSPAPAQSPSSPGPRTCLLTHLPSLGSATQQPERMRTASRLAPPPAQPFFLLRRRLFGSSACLL